jgi:hypothetical protein
MAINGKSDPNYIDELEGSEVEALPAGAYPAKFVRIESIETRFGTALKWHWLVNRPAAEGGDFALSGITTPYLTRNSNGNRIIRALRGAPLAAGETLRVADIEGRSALLIVSVDPESGYNKIKEVTPATTARSQPAEPVDEEMAAAWAAFQQQRAPASIESVES